MIRLALASLLTGLTAGAPVGPTGALCTSLALRGNLRSALAGGAGSALAMGMWGVLAGLGQSWVGATLSAGRIPVITGLLIAGYGIALGLKGPATRDATGGEGAWATTTLCFSMVMLNPAGFVAIVLLLSGTIARTGAPAWVSGAVVGAGVGAGCLVAFSVVMPLMHRLGANVGDRVRRALVRLLAGGLVTFGLLLIARS